MYTDYNIKFKSTDHVWCYWYLFKSLDTPVFFSLLTPCYSKSRGNFTLTPKDFFFNTFHTFSASFLFRCWSDKHEIVVILTSTLRSQIHMNSYCRGEQANSYSVTTVLIRGGEQNVFMSVFACVPYICQWLVAAYENSLLACP